MMIRRLLKQLLRKKGVTNYRIEKDLGIDQSTLSRFFKGEINLSLKNLKRILQYLGYEITLVEAAGEEEGKTKRVTPLQREKVAKDKIQKAIEESEDLCKRTVEAIDVYPGSVKIHWK